ncbi:molybdopterin molybdotransferase MoeA [Halocatena marina]|uniref:Molybdopterin molybdotransferase MoeA n=2 Tax=Halocatena marina TaxID=2934937 RepID=A0ABD5YL35_9EURY|nr:molybdopterin molybdotransferase MoeA [Halocatena marina]
MGEEHDTMLWRTEAVGRMLDARQSALARQSVETIALGEGIGGRVLAEEIVAEENVPAFDHATMDGYAFDTADEYPLELIDSEVFPEDEPPTLESGEAVRIATGAPLPERATAVLKEEVATVRDRQLNGPDLESGTYTYGRASNVTAGETLFEAGERLSAKDAILLQDLGYETVDVREVFSVALLATGSEIHEGKTSDLDSWMLAELLRSWGHKATYEGTVPDEYERVEDRIGDLAQEYDVVLTTGGTSVGKKDHVIQALGALGQIDFHRVRIRPGKPIALAELPETTVVAVPGKPVGAHTIVTLIARPLFLGGNTALPTINASVTQRVDIGPDGFEYAVPVQFEDGAAIPFGHVSSSLRVYEETFDPSVLSSSTRATRADGFFITDHAVKQDETVEVVPYEVLE